VLLHVDIRDEVVVHRGGLSGPVVPRLLLGVAFTVLKSLQLVVEVEDVVSLLIAESSVTVLREDISHILLLNARDGCFLLGIPVDLGDWVVNGVVGLDELVGNFDVRISGALEVLFLLGVVVNVLLPILVAIGKVKLFRHVCN